MDISTKFNVGQKVRIVDVGIIGRISEIILSRAGHDYKVEYWAEAKPETAVCSEDELSGDIGNGVAGIKPESA